MMSLLDSFVHLLVISSQYWFTLDTMTGNLCPFQLSWLMVNVASSASISDPRSLSSILSPRFVTGFVVRWYSSPDELVSVFYLSDLSGFFPFGFLDMAGLCFGIISMCFAPASAPNSENLIARRPDSLTR